MNTAISIFEGVHEEKFPGMVEQLIDEIREVGEEVLNEPYHRFAKGVYARELFIPKGQLIVGKIHKTEHFNIISQGDISVATKEGAMRIQAPYTFVSNAGIQKVVYAHEDTMWTTIHVTDETDAEKIEDQITAKNYLELEDDYQRFLIETGITETKLRARSENKEDQVSMPDGYEQLKVSPSEIEGMGVFTETSIKAGERIGPARISGKRTMLGRYVNHSKQYNSEYVLLENGDLDSIAISDINEDEEILYNYRQGAQMAGFKFIESEVEITKRLSA